MLSFSCWATMEAWWRWGRRALWYELPSEGSVGEKQTRNVGACAVMALARRPKREDEVELSVDVVAILRTGTIVFFVAHSPCFRLSCSSSSYADATSVHGDDQFEHHPSPG